MIGKVSRGSSFGGLSAYLTRRAEPEKEPGLQDYLLGLDEGADRVEWSSVRNLSVDDPELAAMIMSATAEENVRVQKPVYHLSLAVEPDEELSREQWERVADRVLGELGLGEHQVLIVAHNDTEHPHIHLMINRVHPRELKAWDNGHDYYRIEKVLRYIERDMELRRVPGHHYRLPGQERPEREGQETGGERVQRERTGEPSWADQVRFRTYEVFRQAQSWRELEEGLARQGLWLRRRGGGLVVTDGERMAKASRIYRRGSYAWLEKRFGTSFEERQEERRREGGRPERQGRAPEPVSAVRATAPDAERAEQARAEHRGDPVVQRIRFRAGGVLRHARNWGELERGLAAQGLRLKRPGGELVVSDGRHEVAASRIYRRASGDWLEKRYGRSFEAWRQGWRELLDAVDRYRQAEREQHGLEYRVAREHRKVQDAELLMRHRAEARDASRAAARRVRMVLQEIYHPADFPRAVRRIAGEARRDGWEETARRVARRPRRYGRLRAGPIRRMALREQGRQLRRRLVSAAADLTVGRAARRIAGPAAYRAMRVAFSARRKIFRLQDKKGRTSPRALQLDVARRALTLGVSALSLTVCPRPMRVIRTAVQSVQLVRSLGRAARGAVREGVERGR